MKFLILLLIGLGVAGALYYFMLSGHNNVQVKSNNAANSAKNAANTYDKNQQDMMKQLGQ